MVEQVENSDEPEGVAKMNGMILESTPHLSTAGCDMTLLYMPPGAKHVVTEGTIVCLLRSNLLSQHPLALRRSLLTSETSRLRSGEDGYLLFLCTQYHDGGPLMDDIKGMDIEWFEYDRDMYRTLPQIHVGGYRINLWYLGPNKEGGIHNHATDPVPFVEFHTQLRGNGWMVKYADEEGTEQLGERVAMEVGYTHDLFCTVKNSKVTYPWHQYIAGPEGALFIVFEDTITTGDFRS